MKKQRHRFSKAKTLAYLRELQSLGVTRKQAAFLLHIVDCRVSQLMPHTQWAKPPTTLERILTYLDSHPQALVKEIAEAIGSSPGAVVATLWRAGISIKVLRRGFAIPPELSEEYNFLRSKKLTAREAGEALGLIGRGEGGLTPGEALRAKRGLTPSR